MLYTDLQVTKLLKIHHFRDRTKCTWDWYVILLETYARYSSPTACENVYGKLIEPHNNSHGRAQGEKRGGGVGGSTPSL